MAKPGRSARSKLPLSLRPWEITWTPIPDPKITAVLIVAEQGTGVTRLVDLVQPGAGVAPLIERACTHPIPPLPPMRPPRLLCSVPQLLALLQAADLGIPVEAVGSTPSADEVQRLIGDRFTSVLAAMEAHEGRPSTTRAAKRSARSSKGSASSGTDMSRWLVSCDHTIQSARFQPTTSPTEVQPLFLLRMSRADANKVLPVLREVDALRLEVHRNNDVRLYAERAGVQLGLLSEISLDERFVREHQVRGYVVLAVAGDGEYAPFTNRQGALLWRFVRVTGGPPVQMDPVFRGPREAWPKISENFQSYLEAALGDLLADAPPEHYPPMLTTASTAWNAVVLADYEGNTQHIDQLYRLMADMPGDMGMLFERFLSARLRSFRGDPRLVDDAKLIKRGNGWVLRASGRWLANLPLP